MVKLLLLALTLLGVTGLALAVALGLSGAVGHDACGVVGGFSFALLAFVQATRAFLGHRSA